MATTPGIGLDLIGPNDGATAYRTKANGNANKIAAAFLESGYGKYPEGALSSFGANLEPLAFGVPTMSVAGMFDRDKSALYSSNTATLAKVLSDGLYFWSIRAEPTTVGPWSLIVQGNDPSSTPAANQSVELVKESFTSNEIVVTRSGVVQMTAGRGITARVTVGADIKARVTSLVLVRIGD